MLSWKLICGLVVADSKSICTCTDSPGVRTPAWPVGLIARKYSEAPW
jgi:hypothetical protein